VLVTKVGEVGVDQYLNPRTAQVITVDQVKQTVLDVRPAEEEENTSPSLAEYRCGPLARACVGHGSHTLDKSSTTWRTIACRSPMPIGGRRVSVDARCARRESLPSPSQGGRIAMQPLGET